MEKKIDIEVEISRDIQNHWIWRRADHLRAFVFLAMMFKERQVRSGGFAIIHLRINNPKDELGLRTNQIATNFLKKLDRTGVIQLKKMLGGYNVVFCQTGLFR